MVKFYSILLLFTLHLTYSLPGIIFGFSPSGINSILQDLLPALESSLKSLVIPELTLPLVTNQNLAIDLSLQHIKTTSVYIDEGDSGLFFTPDRKILFTVPDMIASFKFQWSTKSHSSEKSFQSGTGKISLSNAQLNVLVQVGSYKKKTFEMQKAEFRIEKFEVDFQESSGVYNWVLEAANKKIKSSIELVISKEIEKFVEEVIGGVEVLEVGGGVEMGVGLVDEVVIDEKHLELWLDGTAKVKDQQYPIDIPNTLQLKYSSPKDFGLYISEYTLNTLLLAKHISSPIELDSEEFGLNITTDLLEPVFEGINKEFGPEENVKIHCKASQYPQIKLTEDLVNGNLKFLCEVIKEEEIVQIELEFMLKISLRMNRGKIDAAIENCKVQNIELMMSRLKKDVNLGGIKSLINLSVGLWKGVLSQILFPDGIVLPDIVKSFTKDAFVEVEIGFLRVEGNVFFPEFS